MQRRSKHSKKAASAPVDPSTTSAACARNIRNTHTVLCGKITSYKIGLSEVADGETGEAVIPKYLNVLLKEIQDGVATLHQELSNLVADADALTEKETRQLYNLICDLERQLQLCKRHKRAAVRSARQRIQTAKMRATAMTDIPEIIPEKVQGTDALLPEDTHNDKDPEPEVEIPEETDKNEISLPDLENKETDTDKDEDKKSLDLDESLKSLPSLTEKPEKTMMLQPPITFQRQQSNMGYPFVSCFPNLPAVPKNRMPSTSSIPKPSFLRETDNVSKRENNISTRKLSVSRGTNLTVSKGTNDVSKTTNCVSQFTTRSVQSAPHQREDKTVLKNYCSFSMR